MTEDKVFHAIGTVKLDGRGSVILPVYMRKSLGLSIGDQLRAELKDGKIVLFLAQEQEEVSSL